MTHNSRPAATASDATKPGESSPPVEASSRLRPSDASAVSGVVTRTPSGHTKLASPEDPETLQEKVAQITSYFARSELAIWVYHASVSRALFVSPAARVGFGEELPTTLGEALGLAGGVWTCGVSTQTALGTQLLSGQVVTMGGSEFCARAHSLDHWTGFDGFLVIYVSRVDGEAASHGSEDLFDALPVAAMLVRNGLVEAANGALHDLFRAPRGSMLGVSAMQIIADGPAWAALPETVVRQLTERNLASIEMRVLRADGTRVWLRLTGRYLRAEVPQEGTMWTLRDISDDVEQREQLHQLNDEHDALLNHGSFGVALTHGDRIERCNSRFAELYGTSVADLLQRSTIELDGFGGPARPEISRRVRIALSRNEPVRIEARVRRNSPVGSGSTLSRPPMKAEAPGAEPEELWVAFTGKPLARKSGEASEEPRIVWLAEDISERKEAERILEDFQIDLERRIEERTSELEQTIERLHHEVETRRRAEQNAIHIATHDALTGLPNRSFFEDRLAHALAIAGASRQELALLFVDVDHFKHVNDTLGHGFGDRLVQEVATRARTCLREHDTIARLGGDEFVVLLPSLIHGARDASGIAERILAAVAEPINIDGIPFETTASIGIACFPADGEDPMTLMRHADLALYQAKDQGRAGYSYFTRSSADALTERVSMEQDLRRAIARNELRLAYQPRVSLVDGHVCGLEALLRWDHPTLGAVSPAKFVPLAEQMGLIGKLGEFALRAACLQAVHWEIDGVFSGVVAVNVSAKQLQPGLLEIVESALTESGLAPGRLELEITETVLAANDGVAELLLALAARGVHIALDDFGTGYSNLAALQRLPISVLKIDRSLVSNIDKKDGDAVIARAMIQLAHTLEMTVIAEGVETEEQREVLRGFQCDEFQGYLFTPPLPPAKLEPLLLAHAPRATRPSGT